MSTHVLNAYTANYFSPFRQFKSESFQSCSTADRGLYDLVKFIILVLTNNDRLIIIV